MNYFKSKSGFTLVELMVTISMIAIFVTMAATYSRTADQQIALYREEGRVVNAIYQARSLAITTFNRDPNSLDACGYGIHIASSTSMTIFEDLPDSSRQCKSYTQPTGAIYTGADENYQTVNISGVTINVLGGDVNTGAVDVLFVPPDPEVFSNQNFPITLLLHAPAVTPDLNITINQFGQVTVQ